jgi:hypothetical protein
VPVAPLHLLLLRPCLVLHLPPRALAPERQ